MLVEGDDTVVASDQGDFCLLGHSGCSGWEGHHVPKSRRGFQPGSWSLGCVPTSLNNCAELILSLLVLGRAEPLPLPIRNLMEKRFEVWCGQFPCPTSVGG